MTGTSNKKGCQPAAFFDFPFSNKLIMKLNGSEFTADKESAEQILLGIYANPVGKKTD